MSDLSRPADELRAAVILLGGISPLLEDMMPDRREKVEKLVAAATRRVMKVVFLLEPRRAQLAKGRS